MTKLEAVASHGPDLGGGHLVRALTGEEHGAPRWVGQRVPSVAPVAHPIEPQRG